MAVRNESEESADDHYLGTTPGVEVAYRAAGRPAVVGPTIPEVDHLGVGSNPVAPALGRPAHHTGPFVVSRLAGATSPMDLDRQQS